MSFSVEILAEHPDDLVVRPSIYPVNVAIEWEITPPLLLVMNLTLICAFAIVSEMCVRILLFIHVCSLCSFIYRLDVFSLTSFIYSLNEFSSTSFIYSLDEFSLTLFIYSLDEFSAKSLQ